MKQLIIFLVSALVIFSSCGGTTVKVKQSSDGVNATISVQTNNPTNVDVNPSISVTLDELNDLLKVPTDTLVFDDSGTLSFTKQDLARFHRDKIYNLACIYGYL